MIDTSPDGDSFSTLWKFLTKVASQVKTSSMYIHQGCVTVPKLLGLEPGRVCEHLRISQSCSYIVYFFFFFLRIVFLSHLNQLLLYRREVMLLSRLKVWLRCVFLQWGCQPSKNNHHMCSFCWYLLAVSWLQPLLVYQDKHMLCPHKAAMALWAEISLPVEVAGEIPKKEAYEQRLKTRGFLSRLFSKKMVRKSWTRGIPTWNASAAEGFVSSFLSFTRTIVSPTSHKIHLIILSDR